MSKKLEDCVTTIPDFPKPGIMFRDITTIISDPEGFKMAVDQLCDMVKGQEEREAPQGDHIRDL